MYNNKESTKWYIEEDNYINIEEEQLFYVTNFCDIAYPRSVFDHVEKNHG